MNRIYPVHRPLEPLVIWENGFTDEDIKQIVALGELADFKKGEVGMNADAKVDGVIRDTDVAWINPDPTTQWLYHKMQMYAAQINSDKFQFDLTHFQNLQYGKYKPGGHYSWHQDAGPNLPEHRKLTFVLGLSDPNDYEGGELQLNTQGDHEKSNVFKIRRGDLVVFPSYVPHRVTPVTSGVRMTLVGWAVGPKFK